MRPRLLSAVLILGLCAILRVADVFIIRSDEWLGEQVLTKVVGFALVVAYVRLSGRGLARLGFLATTARAVFGVGLAYTAAVMALAFVATAGLLMMQGPAPRFVFGLGAVDLRPDQALGVALMPVAALVAGNIVNALMKERLFRSTLLTHFSQIMMAGRANAVPAVLFGLWHLVRPLRAAIDGDMAPAAALSFGAGPRRRRLTAARRDDGRR